MIFTVKGCSVRQPFKVPSTAAPGATVNVTLLANREFHDRCASIGAMFATPQKVWLTKCDPVRGLPHFSQSMGQEPGVLQAFDPAGHGGRGGTYLTGDAAAAFLQTHAHAAGSMKENPVYISDSD